MLVVAKIITGIVALLHLYFLWLEMFAWTTKAKKVFRNFPKDLFGYGIEDQLFFVSKKIGSENDRFLEVVYQGTVILYAYRDKNQRNHFYLENPTTGQLEILTQKTIKICKIRKKYCF